MLSLFVIGREKKKEKKSSFLFLKKGYVYDIPSMLILSAVAYDMA